MPKIMDGNGFPGILFEASTGKSTGPPLRHGIGILSSDFSTDGSLVLTAGADGTCRVWDARAGKPLTPLLPQPANAQRCVFAANGRRFATADFEGNVRVWELGERAMSGAVSPAHDDLLPSSFNASVAVLSGPGVMPSSWGFPAFDLDSGECPPCAVAKSARRFDAHSDLFSRRDKGTSISEKRGHECGFDGAGKHSLWALNPAVREVPFNDPTGESTPADLLDHLA